METDLETQCKHKTERYPNADMWQLRTLHTPKRKKSFVNGQTACKIKMQPTATQSTISHQNRRFRQACWLLLKQGTSTATSKIEI